MTKELKGVCEVCKSKTNQIFNIEFKRVYICKNCEYRIVKQSIMDKY